VKRPLFQPHGESESGTAWPVNTATVPVPKLEEDCYDWWERHKQVLAIKDSLDPEIVLIGDSITHFWGGEPKSDVVHGSQPLWQSIFAPYRVLNLGFGWDRTQNVLWRLEHGEMDGLRPHTVIINIGTNNTSETVNARANSAAEIAAGAREIGARVRAVAPEAAIVLMAVFPREAQPDNPRRKLIADINERYAELAEEMGFVFIDIGPQLLERDGTLPQQIAFDFCHLTDAGYRKWADALKPYLPSPAGES